MDKFYKILYVFFISMLPIVELRGGLPIAILPPTDLSWYIAYPVCIIANLLPIPFILLFIRHILKWMSECKIKLFNKVANFIYKKADKHKGKIEKGGFVGLMLFVGIPLPGTGAWTGALVAALLGVNMKKSVPAIALGVLIAAAIMGGISIFSEELFIKLFA